MKTEVRTQGHPGHLIPDGHVFVVTEDTSADLLLLKGGPATIIQHNLFPPDYGRKDLHEVFEVRKFNIARPCFEEGDMGRAIVPSVWVTLQLKRHRRWHAFYAHPSDQQYFTIERGGRVIFDSRRNVPWPPNRDEQCGAKPNQINDH
jgi:hypothetical protein